MTGIYLDTEMSFETEKVASIQLGKNVLNWTQELPVELYRYLPFLNKYEMVVRILQVDAERGYGYGYAEIKTPTNRNAADLTQGGDIKYSRIPIIIRKFRVAPFDVFMDNEGQFFPLTEERFLTTMSQTSTFDTAKDRPKIYDSLIENLFPPMANRHSRYSAVTKTASAFPLLTVALLTTNKDAYSGLIEKLATPNFQAAIYKTPAFHKAASIIADYVLDEEVLSKEGLLSSIVPNVIQAKREMDGNYILKYANSDMFYPVEEKIAAHKLASYGLEPLELGQYVNLSTDLDERVYKTPEYTKVNTYGLYKVANHLGSMFQGVVLPIVSIEGTPLNKFLFSDGENYAIQEVIFGEKLAHRNLMESYMTPKSTGTFVFEKDGESVATPLFTIDSVSIMDDEEIFLCSNGLEKFACVYDKSNLLKVAAKIEDKYIIPTSYHFVKTGYKKLSLADGEEEARLGEKRANAKSDIIIEAADKDHVILRGYPLAKVGSAQIFSNPDAEFLLVSSGVPPTLARIKVDEAHIKQSSRVTGSRMVTPIMEAFEEHKPSEQELKVYEKLASMKEEFLKVAASVDDMNTVDALLALNLVTPESLSAASDLHPLFNEVQSRLAELLVLTRLGAKELPEQALKSAMKNLEEICNSLKGVKVVSNERIHS